MPLSKRRNSKWGLLKINALDLEAIDASDVSSHLCAILPLPAGEGRGLSRRSNAKPDEGEPFAPEPPPYLDGCA
jgi:hypothetical protein